MEKYFLSFYDQNGPGLPEDRTVKVEIECEFENLERTVFSEMKKWANKMMATNKIGTLTMSAKFPMKWTVRNKNGDIVSAGKTSLLIRK